MPLVLSGSTGITSDNISSLAASKLTGQVADTNIAAMAASKLTGQISDANANSGSVLQIVQAYDKTRIRQVGSGTLWSGATITPSSSNNKILIIASMAFGMNNLNGGLKLLRNNNPFMPNLDSTYQESPNAQIGAFNTSDDNTGTGQDYSIAMYTLCYLDSPNSTSAQQYSVYYLDADNNGFVNWNRQNTDNGGQACSTMILMEIAA